jgi:hypothetical protein
MAKRGAKKVNLNLSSGEDTKFSKLSKKEQGKAIGGDPDDWDRQNIQQFIDMFEVYKPGLIRKMRQDVDVEMALSSTNKYAEVSKDSGMRRAFWLPDELSAVLEMGYPSFWTNPKHARWFIRHFPQFSFESSAKKSKR